MASYLQVENFNDKRRGTLGKGARQLASLFSVDENAPSTESPADAGEHGDGEQSGSGEEALEDNSRNDSPVSNRFVCKCLEAFPTMGGEGALSELSVCWSTPQGLGETEKDPAQDDGAVEEHFRLLAQDGAGTKSSLLVQRKIEAIESRGRR